MRCRLKLFRVNIRRALVGRRAVVVLVRRSAAGGGGEGRAVDQLVRQADHHLVRLPGARDDLGAATTTSSAYQAPATTSAAPKATTTTTQAPKPTTTQAAETKQAQAAYKESSSSSSGSGSSYSGQATYYFQGGAAGSCGNYASDSDYVVAVNAPQMNSGWCGRSVKITNTANGKTISAKVADTCPGCGHGSLDLSEGAFGALGSYSSGVLPISWSFN
ncbi:hypothetical protein JCM10450v2_000237 [Rhodotorula kratochvilovae]